MSQEIADAKVEVLHLAPDTQPAKASLADLQWMQGLWHGAIGKNFQEIYVSEQLGSQMGGYVRGWFGNGKPWFYEITVFVEVGDSIEQQLMIFGPDFKPWQKEGQYIRRPLVKKTKNALYFDGITYVNKSANEHLVYFKMTDADNAGEIIVVHQLRKNLTNNSSAMP